MSLLPSLMYFAVLPYEGHEAASEELAGGGALWPIGKPRRRMGLLAPPVVVGLHLDLGIGASRGAAGLDVDGDFVVSAYSGVAWPPWGGSQELMQ